MSRIYDAIDALKRLWMPRQAPSEPAHAIIPAPAPIPTPAPVMLILRGIAGIFGGEKYPRGALDEPSALAFAKLRGYDGYVLDVAGWTGINSDQTKMALAYFRATPRCEAIYGFSGGGYNVKHILDYLNQAEKRRLKLVVVLGAPNNPSAYYRGTWELVYRVDPPGGHMAGPKVLLDSAMASTNWGAVT
jgi:hypothetical protein